MLPKKSVTVTPQGGGYVDGIWQRTAGSPRTEEMIIQPAGETALQREPGGRRNRVVYHVLGYGSLDDGQVTGQAEIVEYNGREFEASSVRNSDAGVLPHYEANLLRIENESA